MSRLNEENLSSSTAFGDNGDLGPVEASIEQGLFLFEKESLPKIKAGLKNRKNNYQTQQAIVLDKVTDILESPAEYSLVDNGDDQLPASLRHGSVY